MIKDRHTEPIMLSSEDDDHDDQTDVNAPGSNDDSESGFDSQAIHNADGEGGGSSEEDGDDDENDANGPGSNDDNESGLESTRRCSEAFHNADDEGDDHNCSVQLLQGTDEKPHDTQDDISKYAYYINARVAKNFGLLEKSYL